MGFLKIAQNLIQHKQSGKTSDEKLDKKNIKTSAEEIAKIWRSIPKSK